MVKNQSTRLLFTHSMANELIQKLNPSITATVKPFVSIHAEPELKNLLEKYQSKNWIISSLNAAQLIHQNLTPGHNPHIYTFSAKAANYLEEKSYHVEYIEAQTANQLLWVLHTQNKLSLCVYLCSNLSKKIIARDLQQYIQLVPIYHSQTNRIQLPHRFDAVSFISPSGAEAFFFSGNMLSDEAKIFTIGRTTLMHIRRFSNNAIILSHESTKSSLVKKINQYYSL